MRTINAFTPEQFNDLLDAQIGLNIKYSGESWTEIPDTSLMAATFAELGELLESSPRVGDDPVGWKWWKTYLENDDNNMKIEAVDIIHFTVSSLFKKYYGNFDLLKAHYAECSTAYKSTDLTDEQSKGVMYDLLVSISVFSISCLLPESETKKEQAMDMFVFLIDALCNYAKMTPDEMFELYMKKNKLNHERVEGGYMEDKYEKYDENGNEDNTKLFEK